MAADVSPLAGKIAPASMLMNVPRLMTAYFSGQPDLARKTDADYQATLIRQRRASANVGYKTLPWR